MKIPRNTHLFTGSYSSKFKCEECEFISVTIETMVQVHIVKCCFNYFECGILSV